jgi:hypothetical protein
MANGDRTLRERISEDVQQGFTRVSGVLAGHTREIVGDALGSLIDDVKGITEGAFSFLKSGVVSIWSLIAGRNPMNEMEEQTGLLTKLLDQFKL